MSASVALLLEAAMGAGIAVSGYVLISKALNKVYRCAGFNINVALCGVLIGMIAIVLGGWMVLAALGIA